MAAGSPILARPLHLSCEWDNEGHRLKRAARSAAIAFEYVRLAALRPNLASGLHLLRTIPRDMLQNDEIGGHGCPPNAQGEWQITCSSKRSCAKRNLSAARRGARTSYIPNRAHPREGTKRRSNERSLRVPGPSTVAKRSAAEGAALTCCYAPCPLVRRFYSDAPAVGEKRPISMRRASRKRNANIQGEFDGANTYMRFPFLV